MALDYPEDLARRLTLQGDMLFKKRMLKAMARKRENCVAGTFKDPRPWAIRTIRPDPVNSGCSSSGALCADAATPMHGGTDF